ncbi:CLUMA_CG020809, isoform A [Clunio marinus]|uniref:CLUMA_CG020809, isoform A n=1 Tax=Clunio marinus TaxID=568069 RepID=A0A1J1J633_9DIPT|nr:CLUMA_CG020809, isoform A [Clunio marinus]
MVIFMATFNEPNYFKPNQRSFISMPIDDCLMLCLMKQNLVSLLSQKKKAQLKCRKTPNQVEDLRSISISTTSLLI